ncbi:OLC1v1030048C1 [Oldenlandia corymbosa var. corymbosa]|uniref:OLC1v1030048C1 n=1 Tax=Oldenlandia corymbosa var. corymbosa TaxID=529605 RepID=A0AAV1CG65_OLDCO|nr:OLC1v1030048C1 [Oldenlandia corymbosa var. corymbosa]
MPPNRFAAIAAEEQVTNLRTEFEEFVAKSSANVKLVEENVTMMRGELAQINATMTQSIKANEDMMKMMFTMFEKKFVALEARFSDGELNPELLEESASCKGKNHLPHSICSCYGGKLGKIEENCSITKPNYTQKSVIDVKEVGEELGIGRSYNAGGKVAVQNDKKGGYVCKMEHINLIIVDNDVDLDKVHWLGEELGGGCKEMEISSVPLHTISCWEECWALEVEEAQPRKLIIIIGYINGEMVRILVDTGAVRSFIDNQLAIKLGLDRKVCQIELSRGGRRFMLQGHSLEAEDEIQEIMRNVVPLKRPRMEAHFSFFDKRMKWFDPNPPFTKNVEISAVSGDGSDEIPRIAVEKGSYFGRQSILENRGRPPKRLINTN